MSDALLQLRHCHSSKHHTLLQEIRDWIDASSGQELQDFLKEAVTPKSGLFDLLRYVADCYFKR